MNIAKELAKVALQILVPVVGAGLTIGVAEQFSAVLAMGQSRQGLWYLPWFGLHDFLGGPGIAVMMSMLPLVIAWLVASRLNKSGTRGATVVTGALASSFLGIGRLDLGIGNWIGAGIVTMVLGGLMSTGGKTGRGGRRFGASVAVVTVAVVLVLLVPALRTRSVQEESSRNVVLVVLDTVAASHMATYGYGRVTTPELDRLASRGVVFKNSFASAPWTLPSHASLFTGLYSISHGATQEHLFLEEAFVTLAELLRNAGFHTFGATNNAVIGGNSNLDQGFVTYLQMPQDGREARRPSPGAHPTNLAALEFIDSLGSNERFFVFLNYIEAHAPYRPRRDAAERFLEDGWSRRVLKWASNQGWGRYYMGEIELGDEEFGVLRDLYDAELAGLSRTIGELVEALQSRGRLEDTVVIVTSDHGENLGDHGHMDHVFDLHDTLLRVPLIFYGGGLPEGVERLDPVTTVDLFPTILALAGVEHADRAIHGRDLLADQAAEVRDLGVVAEYYYPLQVMSVLESRRRGYQHRFGELEPYLRRQRSIRVGDWKLIWATDGRHALYNLAVDPDETVNLAGQETERLLQLEKTLLARLRRLSDRDLQQVAKPYDGPLRSQGFENLDEDTRDQLKALGYLD